MSSSKVTSLYHKVAGHLELSKQQAWPTRSIHAVDQLRLRQGVCVGETFHYNSHVKSLCSCRKPEYFGAVQVITVKAKYVVDNQTGMPIEIKQRGTPDLPPDFISEDNQCARRLAINERQAPPCH